MNKLTEWLEQFFDEVEPLEFYRDVFPAGSLDQRDAMTKGKYTGIVCAIENLSREERKKKKPRVYRYNITDDLQTVQDVTETDLFCVTAPLSYAGKSRTAENARELYGIAIDLDKVLMKGEDPLGLRNLWTRHIEFLEILPKPTYIVSSGTGLHLYYLMERPIRLYKETARQLQKLKRELTRKTWDDTIADIHHPNEVQYEGIYQGFRMPGTITKNGDRVRAFLTGERVTVEYLNSFVREEYQVKDLTYKSTYSLGEAKEKFPDWYERRIERKESVKPWCTNRAVYEWWKKEIFDQAIPGHRYWCMWSLAIYAQKCSYYDPKHNPNPVTMEELERDALELMEIFESKTNDENNHFEISDVQDALEGFNESWIRYHKEYISFHCAIHIKENRRNGRKQAEHLRRARALRDLDYPNGKWINKNGRPNKMLEVQKWRMKNPEGKKADCCRETGITKPTVYKYWDV